MADAGDLQLGRINMAILVQSTEPSSAQFQELAEAEALQLTPKEYVFISIYLQSFNHRLAAQKAGYNANHGYALLKSPKIAAAVEKSLKHAVMSPDEVLARLSAQASADISEIFDIDDSGYPRMNLRKCLDAGKMHLIKSLSFDARGMPKVELHDAQAALVAMGKVYALFIDRREDTLHVRETLEVQATVQAAIADPTLLRQMIELGEKMGAVKAQGTGPDMHHNPAPASAEGPPRLPATQSDQEG